MAWGTGCTAFLTGKNTRIERQSKFDTGSSVYSWEHRFITCLSWCKRGMTAAAAQDYIPTPTEDFYLVGIPATRADDSGQWVVTWDEETLPGAWVSGYGEVVSVTVTFDGQSGTTPSPTTKTVGYTLLYGALATTTRSGYTFGGWYTEVSGGGDLIIATTIVTVSTAHTLYAKWTAV